MLFYIYYHAATNTILDATIMPVILCHNKKAKMKMLIHFFLSLLMLFEKHLFFILSFILSITITSVLLCAK